MPSLWKFNERLALSILRKLGPELAHGLAIWCLKILHLNLKMVGVIKASGLLKKENSQQVFPSLKSEVFGLSFATPLGLAAGRDKGAEIVSLLLQLGFSSVEVGTFTPQRQGGNRGKRLFRLRAEKALMNRMGLNNCGFDQAERNLRSTKDRQGVVGVSIGANTNATDKIPGYVEGVVRFSELADYLVLNLSCPSVAGVRNLQKDCFLNLLLQSVNKKRNGETPLLLKIAPDLSLQQEQNIAKIALNGMVDGLVISNTLPTKWKVGQKMEQVGLSGRPLFELSTRKLERMYKLTKGRVPLVGVGGIFTAEDAYAKILAGASLVQLYTALSYEGFSVIDRIHKGLAEFLERDGYESISDAVGQGVSHAVEQEHDAFQQPRRAVA